ncbi:glycosyltransferase family 2 protein [Enterobacter sp.]|uniref:glycosyltransferase family 2 protein n=1 Tax=Enterobacter sp. TaxID=42895 RepID=UPI00296EB221|nr:glycosyltransferase family 2 protein [Enterobacter sp.]
MISIITVCYNAKTDLSKTMDSIAKQVGNIQVEVIVIDGGSTDGSQYMLEQKYRHIVSKFISEKDKGIYDAMNKGIKQAHNEWIYFLNAGDVFANTNAVSNISQLIESGGKYNFIHAPYISDGVTHTSAELCLQYLSAHMINHQSILYRKELFDEELYDTSYRFCADYAHLLNSWAKIKAVKANFVIANFDSTGISSSEHNKKRMWEERIRAVWNSSLPVSSKIVLSKRAAIAYPYHYLKGLISSNEKR